MSIVHPLEAVGPLCVREELVALVDWEAGAEVALWPVVLGCTWFADEEALPLAVEDADALAFDAVARLEAARVE